VIREAGNPEQQNAKRVANRSLLANPKFFLKSLKLQAANSFEIGGEEKLGQHRPDPQNQTNPSYFP
jgi:hypothetical protein